MPAYPIKYMERSGTLEWNCNVVSEAVLGEAATTASLQETVREEIKDLSFFLNITIYEASGRYLHQIPHLWISSCFAINSTFLLTHRLNSNTGIIIPIYLRQKP